jgi:hypothetical protein
MSLLHRPSTVFIGSTISYKIQISNGVLLAATLSLVEFRGFRLGLSLMQMLKVVSVYGFMTLLFALGCDQERELNSKNECT